MEGSNYWGYGYKTQHSYPRLQLITWRRPEVKFGWNAVKKKQHKNYQDEEKKSAINKKINPQIKKPHLKMIPIKDNSGVKIWILALPRKLSSCLVEIFFKLKSTYIPQFIVSYFLKQSQYFYLLK